MRTLEKDLTGGSYENTIEVKNLLKKGFHKLGLTNWENSKEPKIEPYSSIDINGTMFVFDKETDIQNLGDLEGLLYIISDIDSSVNLFLKYVDVCVYEWDHIKKGNYTPSGNRVVASLVYDSVEETYRYKKSYLDKEPLIKIMEYSPTINGNAVINEDYFYHNGFFYTIGANQTVGYGGYILKTRDGQNWQVLYESEITSDELNYGAIGVVNDVLYFEAAYYTGSSWKSLAFFSYDGTTLFESSWSGNDWGLYELKKIVYKGGKYIRYNRTGSSYYSEDLETWTSFSEGLTSIDYVLTFYDMVFISGDGKLLYSEDGITFSNSSLGTRSKDYKIQIVNSFLYVTCIHVVNVNLTVTYFWVSVDGINFTQKPNFPNQTAFATNPNFGYINNKIFGANRDSVANIHRGYISDDNGETWTEVLSGIDLYGSGSEYFDAMGSDSKYLFIPTRDSILKTNDLNSFSPIISPQELETITVTSTTVGVNHIICGANNSDKIHVITI